MIKLMVCVFLMVAGISNVKAEQGCPYTSMIKYVDGYFQTTTRPVRWQSQKIGQQDFIDQFIGAIFTPGNTNEREKGYVDKCSYLTNNGRRVDLRYGKPGEAETMSLTSTLHWQLATDPLGLPVYICQDSQPDNCKFTVKIPKR